MWHVSSRSGVATLLTDIHLLLTYLTPTLILGGQLTPLPDPTTEALLSAMYIITIITVSVSSTVGSTEQSYAIQY